MITASSATAVFKYSTLYFGNGITKCFLNGFCRHTHFLTSLKARESFSFYLIKSISRIVLSFVVIFCRYIMLSVHLRIRFL